MFGLLEISFGIGSAFGSWIGGYLFDTTGSYTWSLVVCLFCFIVSGLAIRACEQRQSKNELKMDNG
jgi:predicted MFS family arabinose efflux permease